MAQGYTRLAALTAILFFFSGAAAAYDYPIAGLEPSIRPAGAPMILMYPKNAAWYRHALTGIVPSLSRKPALSGIPGCLVHPV